MSCQQQCITYAKVCSNITRCILQISISKTCMFSFGFFLFSTQIFHTQQTNRIGRVNGIKEMVICEVLQIWPIYFTFRLLPRLLLVSKCYFAGFNSKYTLYIFVVVLFFFFSRSALIFFALLHYVILYNLRIFMPLPQII